MLRFAGQTQVVGDDPLEGVQVQSALQASCFGHGSVHERTARLPEAAAGNSCHVLRLSEEAHANTQQPTNVKFSTTRFPNKKMYMGMESLYLG